MVWIGFGAGCISVPEDLRADMVQPDGSRPNNFGQHVDAPDGVAVHPDRPTIAAASPAPDDTAEVPR